MPRYYFHILDGVADRDETGIELADFGAAKREARRLAGKMLSDSASVLDPDDEWHIEVADESGTVLFRLGIIMRDAAAVVRP